MFAISVAIHLLLGAVWSATRLYSVQNVQDSSQNTFTLVRPATITRAIQPAPSLVTTGTPSATSKTESRQVIPPELIIKPPSEFALGAKINGASEWQFEDATNLRMGPFQSEIDPKKAWINVAESVNYDLLRGISMDISQGEYRLPDELDARVRAKGELTIEYPLIAAVIGKEAVIYVLLLIDEEGKKIRVQIVRGDPDFDNAVLQSLEKVEFRPAMLKQVPVRSLLLLEFEFRRNPPEIGSL